MARQGGRYEVKDGKAERVEWTKPAHEASAKAPAAKAAEKPAPAKPGKKE